MAITHGGDIFAVAAARGWDWRDVADFSASINPLGPSARVRRAICNTVDRIQHYPEREPKRLREVLAAKWEVTSGQILLGNGATELIFFLSRVLQENEVNLAAPIFSEFHRAFPAAQTVNLGDSKTWPDRGTLVLTTPANPTGQNINIRDLVTRLDQTKDSVVVDESFLEFSGSPSVAGLLEAYPQLIILRSLTKFYALPGLRVGALIGNSALLDEWRKVREPWQVNVLAEEAALAAVADETHSRASINFVVAERKWLFEAINSLPGAAPVESNANFLYVPLEFRAQDLVDHLLRHKILVRNCTDWPGLSGEAIRVAVRTRPENERLIEAWSTFSCA